MYPLLQPPETTILVVNRLVERALGKLLFNGYIYIKQSCMTIAAIRKKLMTYIADADDKKVKGLYMLVEDEMNKAQEFELTDAHLKLLDEERAKHLNGESKSYSWEEAKTIIRGKRKV